MTKVIYRFSKNTFDTAELEDVGAKSYNLMQMNRAGLNVPPGFTLKVGTDAHSFFSRPGAMIILDEAIKWLESETNRAFEYNLKVSVRSGSVVSMPGMMDTIINVDNRKSLIEAIGKVYDSWSSLKAKAFRSIKGLPNDLGTGVTIQLMVDGTADKNSGTGIVLTRHPISGHWPQHVDYLPQKAGPELVDGRQTPKEFCLDNFPNLTSIGMELTKVGMFLERFYKHPQEIEFTIEKGKLYILQTRNLRLTPAAKNPIAYDFVREGIMNKDEAIETFVDVAKISRETPLKVLVKGNPTALKGLTACPGVVRGFINVDTTRKDVFNILFVNETTTDDLEDMEKAVGIVTKTGGITSHAAAVARILNKPTIVGVGTGDWKPQCGEAVTLDATNGKLYKGHLPVIEEDESKLEKILKSWINETK